MQELETWFAAVEAKAWAYVNASSNTRPSNIFLVTGQILTTEYAISHQDRGSSTCEVYIDANAEVPSLVKSHVLTGYGFQKVSASVGFQVAMKKLDDNDFHSIFLKVFKSSPTLFIRKASLFQRLVQVHG